MAAWERRLRDSLRAEGARLVLVGRREPPLQEIAGIARSDGGEAMICSADASTEDGCSTMIEAAVREFGRVDVLYCNMGDYAHGDLETHETSPDAWDYLLNRQSESSLPLRQGVDRPDDPDRTHRGERSYMSRRPTMCCGRPIPGTRPPRRDSSSL